MASGKRYSDPHPDESECYWKKSDNHCSPAQTVFTNWNPQDALLVRVNIPEYRGVLFLRKILESVPKSMNFLQPLIANLVSFVGSYLPSSTR